MNQESKLPQVVIGVPGQWTNDAEIVSSIAENSGGYLFAGSVLINIESKWSCMLEVYDHEPQMRRAFEIAGFGRIDDSELQAIDEHTHTLYLSGDGGSFDSARNLMNAAAALLKCGGLAVKIESTGIAHSAEAWNQLTNDNLLLALLNAYVTYVGDEGEFYSCGMHNIGFRDAVVTADLPPDEAASLLHQFLRYIAIEDPAIYDNETFSVDEDSPRYQLCKAPCTMFPPEDLFHNPYGIWQLSPV